MWRGRPAQAGSPGHGATANYHYFTRAEGIGMRSYSHYVQHSGRAALQRRVPPIVLKAEPASAGDTSFALPLVRNSRMSGAPGLLQSQRNCHLLALSVAHSDSISTTRSLVQSFYGQTDRHL